MVNIDAGDDLPEEICPDRRHMWHCDSDNNGDDNVDVDVDGDDNICLIFVTGVMCKFLCPV